MISSTRIDFIARPRLLVVALLCAVLIASMSHVSADPPPAEDSVKNSTAEMPAKRWLFTHPSHLRWWILPNMEKFPEQPRVITGVFCIFVEGGRGQDSLKWLGEIKERCKLLGLEFAYGERHSHQSINDIRLPLDARWQKYTIDKLKAYGGKKIALDMEPYYSGAQRYHRAEDREGLRNATSEWQSLGDVDLYIYPMGPEYVHGLALVENALKGDARVHGLDARTYNAANYDDLATYMANRAKLFKSKGMQYTPGFYLYFAKDPEVMKNAAQYDECWLFARTSPNHPDDLPHFGTPSWYPTSPQKKKSQ